ncbi:hypothetical protein HYH02_015219 [Chlamydomonas schloesseri]|uniref:Uncharacterized protein n=1 Tax=Chlamydomonas schloesseri TaxID=2026947 RepID=A0A835SKY0_9CHLO|nr:hypothetical protein HYH02_015219 [Chlamydomonas schloesseri]|eukprot:KAG2424234.1 hypothetical protein HYH02_015219 [Chlamydomonas schloesseri]
MERPASVSSNIVSLGSRLPRYIPVREPSSWVPSSLPGPPAEESSGLDFVDLVKTPLPEVQARLQDAATYMMLGCANGALQRVSAAAAAASPVNVRALTRFRNNVTRNLSPAVALSCSEAMQAAKAATKRRVQELLEQQRAASAAVHGAGAAGPAATPAAAGIAASSVAQVPCRIIVAPASAEQPLETPMPVLCGMGGEAESAADGAAAPVIVVAADVSAVAAPSDHAAASYVAAPADSDAEHAAAPSATQGVPSSSGDDLDALQQHMSEHLHHVVGGGGSGRRRGSRGRGLSGAGRLQNQSDAAWI